MDEKNSTHVKLPYTTANGTHRCLVLTHEEYAIVLADIRRRDCEQAWGAARALDIGPSRDPA